LKKKVIVIATVLVLVLSLSAGVLAASVGTVANEKEKIIAGSEARREQIEKTQRRVMHLFNEYYPEGVEELESVWEAHREFHKSALEDRQEMIEAIREDREEIKSAFESGEIDKAEARSLFNEHRDNVEAMRAEFSLVAEEKKAVQQEVRDNIMEIRDEIRALLEEEEVDETAIAGLLEETLGLFGQHLENDILYHGQFQEIASNYGY